MLALYERVMKKLLSVFLTSMLFLHDASFASLLEYSVPKKSPLDLHVLGTPPAFVLSQDQTLKLISHSLSRILTFSFALTQKNSWFHSFYTV